MSSIQKSSGGIDFPSLMKICKSEIMKGRTRFEIWTYFDGGFSSLLVVSSGPKIRCLSLDDVKKEELSVVIGEVRGIAIPG